MTQPQDVYLTVAFDADQVSDQLVHKFTSPDGSVPVHPSGLYEAEIYFCEGEVFHLRVLGGGRQDRFTSFQIVDCCLLTLPRVVSAGGNATVRYAPPSPFLQPVGASYQMALDFTTSAVDDHDKRYRLVTQEWKRTLNVGTAHGRWELSLTVTVRIFRGDQLQPDIRVFSFDPEGQVGSGRGDEGGTRGVGHPLALASD